MPTLVSVDVEKLLGRFDHHVDFPSDWEFVIIHGPNGVGKTRILELVAAVHQRRLERLLTTPFAFATLTYDDGSTVTLNRSGQLPLPQLADADSPETPQVVITLSRPGDESVSFPVTLEVRTPRGAKLRHLIERELPVDRVGPELWMDLAYGDRVTTRVLLDRYRDQLPPRWGAPQEGSDEAVFYEFVQQVPVHLIETQRLLAPPPQRTRQGGTESPPMTVTRYSQDLAGRLSTALADNSTTSQRLDRTFPRRVLTAPAPAVTDEQIRARYEEQGRLRDRLSAISLLDAATPDLPLPDQALEDWQRRVLWTYLDDTEQKLATFQHLLARAQLLQEIVNARFLFKTFSIVREGFRFMTDEGGELGPGSLSSGEQHELVLAYDLLFNVEGGSLVLIDEPEISLHVSWQQQFLNDLSKISKLQDLRFMIATHSPQIIHKWWDRAKALYEDDDIEPERER